jgi:dTDP-4-amino-4,6-dideoxygalactose transaminase
MTRISYVDLSNHWKYEKQELLKIIDEVMTNGMFVGGAIIEEFEKKVADYIGVKNCVALNSGTDALVCAMIGFNIRPGDEVITPPNSFIASTAAIAHIRAVPVFADVLPDQTIDPEKIRMAITDKTKAIMPVHLTGRMCRMDEINAIAKEHGLVVIEDAAQSIGSKFNGVMSGAASDIGCFSAHPLKNLNACGDGGFAVTNDDAVAARIKSMRNHGLVDRNTVEEFGYVSRMDTIQAAILNYRIDHLDDVITKRRSNAMLYRELLDPSHVYMPDESKEYFNTFHTFVIQVDQRDELAAYLSDHGIQTAIHYPVPIHLQPAAKRLGHGLGDFEATETQSKRILTLPINQFITEEQVRFIADAVNGFFEDSRDE